MKPLPQRKSPRLKGYDYTQSGAYFVTVCTDQRQHLFGVVEDDVMVLSPYGFLAEANWLTLPKHYSHVRLDQYVIMPNHVHGIIFLIDEINDDVGEGLQTLPYDDNIRFKRHGLPEIIRGFKTWSARRINEVRHSKGTPVWQRSFHDHIIRNESDLNRIREYVHNNPALWESDTFFNTTRTNPNLP